MSANHKAVAAAVLAGMFAWIARGEYPSIETARVLFSPGNLNSTNSFYHSEAYRSFMADMVLDSWRNALHGTEAYPSHGVNVESEVEFPDEKPNALKSDR